MDLKDLRYFCATAELEHVTRAAEKLNIAQPYLTRVIHQIEEEVGGELFSKARRQIKLNSYGKVFYRYAKKVLADMDILNSEMDYLFDRKDHTVTIVSNTEAFSTQMIRAFNALNPQYALSIIQVRTSELIEALLDGEAQFALSSPPLPTEGVSDIIETTEVFNVCGIVLLPPNSALYGKKAVTIDELRDEKLITMPRGSGMRNRLKPIFEDNNYQPKILYESDNLNVITEGVKSGMGYAIVTETMMMDYPELWDNAATLQVPDTVGHYGISYNKHIVKGRIENNFLEFLLKFFEDLQAVIEEIRPPLLKGEDS